MLVNEMVFIPKVKRFDDFTFLDFLVHKREEKKCEFLELRNIFNEHSKNRYLYDADVFLNFAVNDVSEISMVAGEIFAYDAIIKEIKSERFLEEVEE